MSQQTFEYLPDDYERKMLEKKRARNRKRRIPLTVAALSITSLMDILTILLVFLLKNYSTDPLHVEPSADLSLPKTIAQSQPETTVTLTVTKQAILLNDVPVASLKDGRVDAALKRGGEDGYFIVPLNQKLSEEMEKIRRSQTVNNKEGKENKLTILMDEEISYRLLNEIMYTAGQAEFNRFSFAAITQNTES